jgi:hypothetical protein
MAQDEHLAFHSHRGDDNLVAGALTAGGVDEGLDLHCRRWRGVAVVAVAAVATKTPEKESAALHELALWELQAQSSP